MTHTRRSYQRAINCALFCPTLPDAAADDLARAQGLLMRDTGYDLDDCRALLLKVATEIPAPWSDEVMAEVIVEEGKKAS